MSTLMRPTGVHDSTPNRTDISKAPRADAGDLDALEKAMNVDIRIAHECADQPKLASLRTSAVITGLLSIFGVASLMLTLPSEMSDGRSDLKDIHEWYTIVSYMVIILGISATVGSLLLVDILGAQGFLRGSQHSCGPATEGLFGPAHGRAHQIIERHRSATIRMVALCLASQMSLRLWMAFVTHEVCLFAVVTLFTCPPRANASL